MSTSNVIFKIKTASQKEIFMHLKECKDSFKPPLDQTVDLLEYASKLAGRSITFEAWINNTLAGLVAAYFNDAENHSGYITSVSVLGNYKGKGIGLGLMNRCIEYAIQNDFYHIKLEVAENNDNAIQLYKKLNFAIFEKKGSKIGMILDLRNLKNKQDGQTT